MIAIMLVPSDRYSTLLVVSLHAYKYDHASGRVNCTFQGLNCTKRLQIR